MKKAFGCNAFVSGAVGSADGRRQLPDRHARAPADRQAGQPHPLLRSGDVQRAIEHRRRDQAARLRAHGRPEDGIRAALRRRHLRSKSEPRPRSRHRGHGRGARSSVRSTSRRIARRTAFRSTRTGRSTSPAISTASCSSSIRRRARSRKPSTPRARRTGSGFCRTAARSMRRTRTTVRSSASST